MAHENCKEHYSDWNSTVHCSFKNVFTASIAQIVGNNLQRILGITHFKPDEMAKQAPLPYDFTCKRKEANSIRDELVKVTTESCSHIWFSMQTDPFHFLYNRRSMLADDPIQVKDYPVYFYFGSMYSYSTFTIHSEQHPVIHELRITKWRDEPETIRIMSKDKSRQIFIPIKWIQKQVLVNTNGRPCVVLMLKYSVKMKKKITRNGQFTYERVCKVSEGGFETIVSKSSDILLSFHDIEHTWAFLDELTRETNEYRNKFTINFVTLKQDLGRENNQSFYLPSSASHKQHYALRMLYSMGYVFQDKYSRQIHEQFVAFNKDSFNDMCYYLKEKLEENHCYNVTYIFGDFATYLKEKRKEKQQSGAEKLPYCIGCVSVTPLRVLYQKMESTIGNRALRMTQFGGEDMFILVHIREEDNRTLKDFDSSIKHRLKSKMLDGIKAMNKTYRLFGTSTSQLKEMSFWFIAIENKSIEDAWKDLGDFSGIKNIANYVARIGLYFTTSYETGISFKYVDKFVPNKQFIATSIDDIETEDKKYCFTDGIGKMSWGVAGLVATKLSIKLESRFDIPSAYQVRIAGCKGMLAIDPESKLDQYYIKVRPSMEKFRSDHWNLEICAYSKPLELKFNNQVIMLLSDLGNKDAVFESYQTAGMTHLSQQNENEQLRKLKYSSAKDDLLKNKIPLPLNEARNMFGVVDETGILEYGQVFIQYKDLDSINENSFIVVSGEVLVAKMPCLHPGDFRKFTAVNVPELKACIRDCIVFPHKGPRPHPNEMSGSDLDGDQYWVYWGKLLKINKMDEPLSYEASSKKLVPKITNEIIIDHIIESFGAASQGIICDVHLAIADSNPNHTRAAECKYLAELFARAVDAPKTGEIIDLDKVYEFRAKYCRGYPQFMKKYDQPIRESNTILNKLFLRARHHFFSQRPSILPLQPLGRSPSAIAQAREQRKTGSDVKDKEFQKWLSSLDTHESENDTTDSQPVLVNSSTTKKPRASIDSTKASEEQPTAAASKQTKKTVSKKEEMSESEPAKASSIKAKKASIDSTSSELLTEQPTINKPTKKTTAKKDEEIESEPVQGSSIKGKKSSGATPVESAKSKEKDESADSSKKLINSAASSVIPKVSLTASSICENSPNRNIVFNGMSTVSNRLKWNQSGDGSFTVDLDVKITGENNAVDKLVQLLLDSGKTSSLSPDTKLTLICSWGELSLKILHLTDDTKPKNIKELNQLIKETNYVEFSFRELDIKTIAKEHEPSNKSAAEYVLVCRYRDVSPHDISLIFDDKKKLKKVLLIPIWLTCAVRGGEQLMDSFYEIRHATDEIDSKHESFSQYLKLIFNNPNMTDVLSGTSPRISIASELLKPAIQIVSLKRLIRCEYANLDRRMSIQPRFDTLKNLEYAFYQVTDISTEKTSGKIQTHETIEFHATQIQIAKKHEQDLKQLTTFAETFFD